MADETYSRANAVARLYEIATFSNQSTFAKNQQMAYDTWMAGGGTPDILGQPLHTRGEFEVKVIRILGENFVETGIYQTVVMRAWKEMPLFNGDRIQTSANSIVAIELLGGGRIGIRKGESVRIDEGSVNRSAPLRPGGLWEKFNAPAKPLTIQTRGGTIGSKG